MQTSSEKNPVEKHQSSAHKGSTPESKLLELDRKVNVPVDRLFAAFSSPDALRAWWWPKGLHADRIDLDFREGGKYFINMKGFDRGGGGMTGEIEEIVENERIVMSDRFADEEGRAISAEEAKVPGVWPEKVFITFDFTTLDEKSSRVKLSQQGIPNEGQKDCLQGWSEMFDKLENYLGGRKN